MKTILLLCASGVTSSLLTRDLSELVRKSYPNYKVVACPIANVDNEAKNASILLLTPQVRFNFSKVKQMYPEKTVLKIENEDYEGLDAKKILASLKLKQ